MRESTIRLSPAERRNEVAADVAALCATGAQYRRALAILAAQYRYERLCIAGLVAGFALMGAALWSGIPLLYAEAAGAFLVTLLAWAIAFADGAKGMNRLTALLVALVFFGYIAPALARRGGQMRQRTHGADMADVRRFGVIWVGFSVRVRVMI